MSVMKMKKLRGLLVCASLVAGFFGCTSSQSASKDLYKSGTYEGSAGGFGGALKVAVTVDAEKIIAVDVKEHSETPGIGTRAIEIIPAQIVAAQSAAVDIVSGATFSSKAIIQAVEAALESAGARSAAAAGMKAGTYTASVYGNNDYINVEVALTNNAVSGITVTKHSETKYLGGAAMDMLSEDIIQYQTLNVDSISGATLTSNAFKAAVADCITQAGGNPASFQKAVPPKGTKKAGVTERSADIIVVGAGGAGLSAAVSATMEGSKVIVIEKMPVIGGNTIRCASAYNTADPRRQAALPMTQGLHDAVRKALAEKPADEAHRLLIADVKKAYDAYVGSGSATLFDSPEWHALQTYLGGDKVGIIDVIRKYAASTLEGLDWLQSLGSPVMEQVSQGAGALWQRTHQFGAAAGMGLIDPLYTKAVDLGIEILTEMKADSLVITNGAVTGIKATDAFGSEYLFKAARAVVLATGGYSNNPVMRAESSPELTPEMVSTNHPGATGDGIVMARAVGAATTGMNYVQVYPLATPGTGALQGRARKVSGLDDVIVVNKEGKRFVHEDARRDDFVAAIKKQTDGICYDINDSTIVEVTNSFDENVETLVKLGRIIKADTLRGIEEQLGMPAGNLEATVAGYNKMVAAKNDPEFGRTLFARPIEKGPFYATPRAPSIHHTMGGLRINPSAQVLNTSGQPIRGLYAAGEVAGGIHGSNRLGGNATADVISFGRVAGKSAAAVR